MRTVPTLNWDDCTTEQRANWDTLHRAAYDYAAHHESAETFAAYVVEREWDESRLTGIDRTLTRDWDSFMNSLATRM